MWFAVSLFFSGRHSNPDRATLWEERIVLIEANNESEAETEAKRLAGDDQPSFKVAGGDSVQWRFEQIERVYPIEGSRLASGTELFSRFLRDEEVASLLTPFEES